MNMDYWWNDTDGGKAEVLRKSGANIKKRSNILQPPKSKLKNKHIYGRHDDM
jgi:hypothetical protein